VWHSSVVFIYTTLGSPTTMTTFCCVVLPRFLSNWYQIFPLCFSTTNERHGWWCWHCSFCLGLVKGLVHSLLVWARGCKARWNVRIQLQGMRLESHIWSLGCIRSLALQTTMTSFCGVDLPRFLSLYKKIEKIQMIAFETSNGNKNIGEIVN